MGVVTVVRVLRMQGNGSPSLRPRAEGEQEPQGGKERWGFHAGAVGNG